MAAARKRESIPDLVREAISDTRDWLKAEIELFRAQISDATGKYATTAIALAFAAILALVGLIYLAYATMLVLTPYFGNSGAALAVGGVLVIGAFIVSLYARATYRRAKFVPPRISKALAEHGPSREETQP
jgi:hypothetical protein